MIGLLLLLAVIQGIAEFLPISSSGHLRILQELFGVDEPLTVVDVLLHLGTLVAVVLVYRKLLMRLVLATWRGLRHPRAAWHGDADFRTASLVVIGTLPTIAIALAIGGWLERAAADIAFVGTALIINAGILAYLGRQCRLQRDRQAPGLAPDPSPPRDLAAMGVRDALLIGIAQGFAVTRGISRSGTTITAAVALNIRQDAAASFSFLLSIPAIIGAVVLHLRDLGPADAERVPMALVAAAVAGLVGFFALTWLLTLLDRGRLGLFAGYSLTLGAAVLAWRFLF
jgi:undecaprenyl-diphosphatase